MLLRRWFRAVKIILAVVLLVLLFAPEWSTFANEENRLQSIVGLRQYDFLVWESQALLKKGETILAGGQEYLDEQARKQVVLDYLELVRKAQHLEAQLHFVYGDPDIADPALETRDLQEELAQTRASLESKQLLAEAIVQEQAAAILEQEGFDLLGGAWPPVLMHMTPLPSLLVVSPRDRIEKLHQVPLEHGLSTPTMEVIEDSVYDDLDRSALVVPLGGIGTYPAMIVETSDINRLAEVVVHEWVHHWLTLKPLGISYMADPSVRIINETVASLVDLELGSRVVETYYPELLPPPPEEVEVRPESQPETAEPPAFDFQTELANTRVRTDELLADGRVEEAEEYMEQRRLEFREHGYGIRKLNQAFFAFYGAYAAEPGGAQGGNPIGPMLRDIRQNSTSVREFLETVAPITSFEDLLETHSRIVPQTNASQ